MVMSAVSSVRTPGVLVTVMPRCRAVARSIWSTPVPKDAISLSCGPAWASTALSIRSVTVGTRISAVRTASISCAWVSGVSSSFSLVSNSSIIRVSIGSGSLRVTTMTGFLLGIARSVLGRAACPLSVPGAAVPVKLARCIARARFPFAVRSAICQAKLRFELGRS